jgi:hypothetical protein
LNLKGADDFPHTLLKTSPPHSLQWQVFSLIIISVPIPGASVTGIERMASDLQAAHIKA